MNEPLHLNSTEAGVTLQLLPDDSPGPPGISLLQQCRHPVHNRAEDIILCKGQEPLQCWLSHLQQAPDDAERAFLIIKKKFSFILTLNQKR